MEAEEGGAKVTALPICRRALTTLTDNCQNILALTHKNPTHRARESPERDRDHQKNPNCDEKVSPPGLLRFISLILWAFLGLSRSHEQPRAAGQGAGLWASTTLQRPTEELVIL